MSVGSNIKKLRLSHGLSQIQLAEIVGTTDKAVSSWENDISIPRMGVIEKLSEYFQVLKSDIIEDSVTPILRYSSNDKINSIIKDLLNTDVADGDLDVIRAILNKYSISQPPVDR